MDRETAYTTPRPDVAALVPDSALRVLDVGCSNGALGASLKRAVADRQVVGIEADPDFCREAGTRLDEVLCRDLNAFDWAQTWPEARFDCIVFADVLEHLADPERHLAGARRCLAAGGSIVVSLPNVRHLSALYAVFVRGTFPRRDRGLFDRTHLHWFTIADARDIARALGLRAVEASYSLRVGDRGDGLLNKIVRKLLDPVAGFGPIREFLSYQFCLRLVAA
jgi:2-polyprenyl-3-methyl-5-hydroxy-6-metoxy-1,4-benzoquinol methylase